MTCIRILHTDVQPRGKSGSVALRDVLLNADETLAKLFDFTGKK